MNTTLFICNCCGKISRSQVQPALVAGRAPLIQVECLTVGCNNHYMTYTFRDGEDNAQVLDLYTPIMMDVGQVGRFAAAIEFRVKAS